MGGINIYCGSFQGRDKSGSAFSGVLDEMEAMAAPREAEAIHKIRAALDEASDHVIVEPDEARFLLPLVRRYSSQLDSELAVPGDPLDQMTRDNSRGDVDPTELKYGKGLGWRAYCIFDLLAAFEISEVESEPVALVW